MGRVKEEVIYQLECIWSEKMMPLQLSHQMYCSRIIFFQSEIFKLIYDLPFYMPHFLIICGPTRRLLLYQNTNIIFFRPDIYISSDGNISFIIYRTTLWIVTFDNTGEMNVWASPVWKKIITNSALISSVWMSRCWKRFGSQTRISTMGLAPTCIL